MSMKKTQMTGNQFAKIARETEAYITKMQNLMPNFDNPNCGASLLCNINTQLISGLARMKFEHVGLLEIARAHVVATASVTLKEHANEVGEAYLLAALRHSGAIGENDPTMGLETIGNA